MTNTLLTSFSNDKLPDYIVFDPFHPTKSILRSKALKISFPLSLADLEDIKILEAKYDSEENCAGLAAPQIGISKQIFIFAVPDDAYLKKWRPDLIQSMPKSIWINPSWIGIEEAGFHTDYEGCFSIKDVAGPVKRYKKINYKAYNIHGELLAGTAEGYLARVIQHETDHLNGILFIDHVNNNDLLPIEEYRKKRKKAMESL